MKIERCLKIIGVLLSILFLFMINSFTTIVGFKEEQMKFPRVRTSYTEKEAIVNSLLAKQQLKPNNLHIFIRAFKKENILEIWGKDRTASKFKLIKSYEICSKSGTLGPKRKQGDMQVPEGFYTISAYNPNSNFYLSMMINYPNQSDKILGVKGDYGNNICIHGNCVTVGCIPITDDCIKEVYLMAIEAKNNGQENVPVHIFPFRLNASNILTATAENGSANIKFWKNLKLGYDAFEKENILPAISVDEKGNYIVK
ncbi:MAG: L,D-transpeptidase family protein [Bacteroidota bacterium]